MLDLSHFRDRLRQAHANARRLRAEAFVRYRPVVAGQPLEPLTLDTYNLLIAWENPFVVGGDCAFHHLVQFIWAHSPDFGQFAHAARRRCIRRIHRALDPRHPTLSAAARVLAPLPRFRWLARFIEPTRLELEEAAIAECQRIVTEGIGEFPTERRTPQEAAADGALDEPLPFALQAQLLNLMRRELGLSYAETRSLPLKELSQLLREVSWVASKGKASLPTAEEAAVWREYQQWREERAKTTP